MDGSGSILGSDQRKPPKKTWNSFQGEMSHDFQKNMAGNFIETTPVMNPYWVVVAFKYFLNFHPPSGEDEPILTSIFFNWVGSTTN